MTKQWNPPRPLTQVERAHLWHLVLEEIDRGAYHGNKAQYDARLQRLRQWLETEAT